MKTKILLLIMVFFTGFSAGTFAQNKKEKKNNKEQVVFDVSMTCENCKKRIEKNIAFEKGVKDMKVDLPAKTVMLEFNPSQTDVEKLQKALVDLGYEASIHESVDK